MNAATSQHVFAGPYLDEDAEREKFSAAFMDMTQGFLAFPLCLPGTQVWKGKQGRLFILSVLRRAAARSKAAMQARAQAYLSLFPVSSLAPLFHRAPLPHREWSLPKLLWARGWAAVCVPDIGLASSAVRSLLLARYSEVPTCSTGCIPENNMQGFQLPGRRVLRLSTKGVTHILSGRGAEAVCAGVGGSGAVVSDGLLGGALPGGAGGS